MADSPSTEIPEAAKTTSTAQLPVQDINVAAEMESDRASAALAGRNGMMDRLVRAIGGGSPQASPSQFSGALGQLGGSSQVGMLRQLQRSYGNSYVGRVIQAKLTVGQPGDRYEEEADRIADEVMRMPEPSPSEISSFPHKVLNSANQLPDFQRPIGVSKAPGLIQRTFRPPPINGKVINNSSNSVLVSLSREHDEEEYFERIAPQSQSDFEHDDVDYVQDSGRQWYKIGNLTTIVDSSGRVSNYICRSYPPPEGECFPAHGMPLDEDAGVPMPESLQRKASEKAVQSSDVPPIVHEVLRTSGEPLDPETRTFMESRFGHDFSQVRVHTDAKAVESAQAVHSVAYTVGQDIVFEAGQYAPKTNSGRQLLAHELTHVIQQSTVNIQQLQKQEISPEPTVREIQQEQYLTHFSRFPLEAHRHWRQLNSGEQTFVIIRMIQLYGYEFARQFRDFAMSGRFDATPEFANRHEATTPIRFQGFQTLEAAGYRLATVDSSGFENWVHPSGRTIFVLHGSQASSADDQSVPPEEESPEESPEPNPYSLEEPMTLPRRPPGLLEDQLRIEGITTPEELRRILESRRRLGI
jgi:Domain of unknown function (DUF4157)